MKTSTPYCVIIGNGKMRHRIAKNLPMCAPVIGDECNTGKFGPVWRLIQFLKQNYPLYWSNDFNWYMSLHVYPWFEFTHFEISDKKYKLITYFNAMIDHSIWPQVYRFWKIDKITETESKINFTHFDISL